jgi:hypothetical protein
LLGASNLTRGLSPAIATASRLWGRPLDLLAAFGHGRSYGLCRGVLGHSRPGIVECGLWEALARRPAGATAALLTDVGNDLLYEVPPAQIAGWVESCLERLATGAARTVVTPLPLCSIARLSPAKFLFLRTILFPGCGLSHATALDRARDLDDRLRTLARAYGARIVEPKPIWYGFDPIHIRRRHLARAWRAILSPWLDREPPGDPVTSSLWRWLTLRRLAPERCWTFGRERRQEQPAGKLADGTMLSFY